MKKIITFLVVAIFLISMVFVGISCKEEAAETEAAETSAVETEAAEPITIVVWDWQSGSAFDQALKK